jgi:Rod binding domain-containing protein
MVQQILEIISHLGSRISKMRKTQAISDTLSQRALYQLYQSLEKLLVEDLLKSLKKEKSKYSNRMKSHQFKPPTNLTA